MEKSFLYHEGTDVFALPIYLRFPHAPGELASQTPNNNPANEPVPR